MYDDWSVRPTIVRFYQVQVQGSDLWNLNRTISRPSWYNQWMCDSELPHTISKETKDCSNDYLISCIITQLIFYTVDDFITSAIAVILLGFFLGLLFPEAMIAQMKILLKRLHVAVVVFVCVCWGMLVVVHFHLSWARLQSCRGLVSCS